MLETIAIAIAVALATVAIVFLVVRRGNKMPAEPKSIHLTHIQDLNEDELLLGYNETIIGIGMAGPYSWPVSRVREEVEIALSLRSQIAISTGEYFTFRNKGKLRNQLTKAAVKSRQGNKEMPNSGVLRSLPHIYSPDDLEDRTRLDEAMWNLRRSR